MEDYLSKIEKIPVTVHDFNYEFVEFLKEKFNSSTIYHIKEIFNVDLVCNIYLKKIVNQKNINNKNNELIPVSIDSLNGNMISFIKSKFKLDSNIELRILISNYSEYKSETGILGYLGLNDENESQYLINEKTEIKESNNIVEETIDTQSENSKANKSYTVEFVSDLFEDDDLSSIDSDDISSSDSEDDLIVDETLQNKIKSSISSVDKINNILSNKSSLMNNYQENLYSNLCVYKYGQGYIVVPPINHPFYGEKLFPGINESEIDLYGGWWKEKGELNFKNSLKKVACWFVKEYCYDKLIQLGVTDIETSTNHFASLSAYQYKNSILVVPPQNHQYICKKWFGKKFESFCVFNIDEPILSKYKNEYGGWYKKKSELKNFNTTDGGWIFKVDYLTSLIELGVTILFDKFIDQNNSFTISNDSSFEKYFEFVKVNKSVNIEFQLINKHFTGSKIIYLKFEELDLYIYALLINDCRYIIPFKKEIENKYF